MRHVFKTRPFARWLRKTQLEDSALCVAVHEMEQGLIDADLGGGLVKKRIAVPGKGKRGGARTLLATNIQTRWIFLTGFEKNERANVSAPELIALKKIALLWLELPEELLKSALAKGELEEICHAQKPEE